MNVPTLNIIMTFDPMVINTIKESRDLNSFKDKQGSNTDVLIFGNGPASHFLSLTHEYGWAGGSVMGQSMGLELEFIDPEGTFENDLLTMDLEKNMPPKATMGSNELKALRDRLSIELASSLTWAQNKDSLAKSLGAAGNSKEYIRRKVEDLHFGQLNINTLNVPDSWKIPSRGAVAAQVAVTNFEKVVEALGGIDNLNKLRLLEDQNAKKSLTQRPVWITYGAGNDFRNWSPVMCFSHALSMAYNWTGDGVRKLNIKYDGVSISPNLTSLGIKPLGALGMGVLIKGQSQPLFDKESNTKELESLISKHPHYTDELELALMEATDPSIHKVITEVIKNYIMTGTSYENVVVAFPDLDILLGKSKEESYLNAEKQITKTIMRNIPGAEEIAAYSIATLAWKDFIETFGLKLVESSKTGYQIPVGADDLRLEEVAAPESVPAYFKSKVYRTVLSSDGFGDLLQENRFLTPLIRVMGKIIKTIGDDGQLHIGATFSTEHGYEMLKLMYKYGMISDPTKPALIYGDPYFVNKYIYARINDEIFPPLDASAGAHQDPRNLGKANVLDKVRGFNTGYTLEAEELIYPSPWATPFGPAGDVPGVDDFSLADDTNIVIDSIKKLSDKERLKLLIFTLGTKNTNILSINFDINNQYLSMINAFTYQTTTAAQYMNAIIPAGKVNACKGLFSQIQRLQLNAKGGEIPEGFKALIRPWLITTQGADAKAQWGKVFASLGIKKSTATEREAWMRSQGNNNPNKRGWTEDRRIKYYWDRFLAMTKKFPKPVIEMGGATCTENVINHINMVSDGMAAHTFTGSMKTLPMFHLANPLSVVERDALLYCVEPRIVGVTDTQGKVQDVTMQQTWFSGMYSLQGGFKHTISGGDAYSEFKFVRSPGRSMRLGDAKAE